MEKKQEKSCQPSPRVGLGPPGASPSASPASPSPTSRAAPGSGTDRAAQGAGPRILGTIDSKDLKALKTERVEVGSAPTGSGSRREPPQTAGQQTASLDYVLPGKTPDAQYKYAFGLLSQADYAEAELALRSFVEQNPNDPLAGNAKYWLGETYYVRQDYQRAAITFAEAYQAYPKSPKAPDNLLKLGKSLAALNQPDKACTTYAKLLEDYPNSLPRIIKLAKSERKKLNCK